MRFIIGRNATARHNTKTLVGALQQWRRGRREGGRRGAIPLKFALSENLLLVRKFAFKHAKFGAENPHFLKI